MTAGETLGAGYNEMLIEWFRVCSRPHRGIGRFMKILRIEKMRDFENADGQFPSQFGDPQKPQRQTEISVANIINHGVQFVAPSIALMVTPFQPQIWKRATSGLTLREFVVCMDSTE
jgi:hypothetical protein